MTLKGRVKRLAGSKLSEQEIFFFKTLYENEDGSVEKFSIAAFICGKNIHVHCDHGETEQEFRARVSALAVVR